MYLLLLNIFFVVHGCLHMILSRMEKLYPLKVHLIVGAAFFITKKNIKNYINITITTKRSNILELEFNLIN